MSAVSSKPLSSSDILANCRQFFLQVGIKTDKVVAITIHKNRSTEFSSLIVNLTSGHILSSYPERDSCSTYKEGKIGNYLYCYNDKLPFRSDEEQLIGELDSLSLSSDAQPASSAKKSSETPFCCSNLRPYKPISTSYDASFQSLRNGSGSHPNLVFEVIRQRDNGPIQSTKYFQVMNDTIQEAPEKPTQKIHSFKNYKCLDHTLFFSVNLFQASKSAGFNHHHMRLIPHTTLNQKFLDQFFADSLLPLPAAEADKTVDDHGLRKSEVIEKLQDSQDALGSDTLH